MFRTSSLPLLLFALGSAPCVAGCFNGSELAACTYTDPTGCDSPNAQTTTTSGQGETGGTGAMSGSDGAGSGSGSSRSTEDTVSPPADPPPSISGLKLQPEVADELGPVVVTYDVSADAIEADLFDDGELVVSAPAGAPLVFPVTSAPRNNPGSTLTVRVHDAAGQAASASVYQPSAVKPPGSPVWTTIEPNDGILSIGGAIALQGSNAIGLGLHWENDRAVTTLRRYDSAGKWKATQDGWSKSHTDWTALAELESGGLTPAAVAVDGKGFIVAVATALVADEPRMYVARFDPAGALVWEVLEAVGTEGRGVAVQSDGTIFVSGSTRTSKIFDLWDLTTWVYGPEKQAYGPDVFSEVADEEKKFSERGLAAVALKSGRIAVVGTRELWDPIANQKCLRSVALLFEGKGTRVGVWTSPGEKMLHDAAKAVVATPDGFAVCGYGQMDPGDPSDKRQILVRWLGEDLQESQAPRLELTPGGGVCHAIGHNREGVTIIGVSVRTETQKDNALILAFRDAATPMQKYLEHNGGSDGQDSVLGLTCDYMCAWTGSEEVNGTLQWITGMIRG